MWPRQRAPLLAKEITINQMKDPWYIWARWDSSAFEKIHIFAITFTTTLNTWQKDNKHSFMQKQGKKYLDEFSLFLEGMWVSVGEGLEWKFDIKVVFMASMNCITYISQINMYTILYTWTILQEKFKSIHSIFFLPLVIWAIFTVVNVYDFFHFLHGYHTFGQHVKKKSPYFLGIALHNCVKF